MHNFNKQPEIQEHNNVHFIYDYTKQHFEMVNNSLDILTTKNIFVLGLTAGLIGLSAITTSKQIVVDTLYRYWMSFEIILCVAALYLCFVGLQPKAAGNITPPKLLMDKHYYESDENCHLIVTKTLIEAISELEQLRNWKAKIVKRAIWCLCTAIACKAIGWIGFEVLLFLK